MGRGGSTTFKRMSGSKVCPRGLAQQRGRLLVPLFVLFSLVCIAGSVLHQGDADVYDISGEDGLTAEVLIVIVGALGRRGG